MNKIARLRREIERLKKENDNIKCDSNRAYCLGYGDAFVDLLPFLDTLSEEPDKSLEEAVEKHINEALFKWSYDDEDGIEQYVHDSFIAGAEWQASRMPMPEDTVLFQKGVAEGRRLEMEDMMKDAVEGYVNYYEDSGGILMAEAQVGCPYHNGDKVRILVLKAEEE